MEPYVIAMGLLVAAAIPPAASVPNVGTVLASTNPEDGTVVASIDRMRAISDVVAVVRVVGNVAGVYVGPNGVRDEDVNLMFWEYEVLETLHGVEVATTVRLAFPIMAVEGQTAVLFLRHDRVRGPGYFFPSPNPSLVLVTDVWGRLLDARKLRYVRLLPDGSLLRLGSSPLDGLELSELKPRPKEEVPSWEELVQSRGPLRPVAKGPQPSTLADLKARLSVPAPGPSGAGSE